MSGACSLGTQDIEERTPTSIHDGLGQMVILHHIDHLKVFNHNAVIAFRIGFRRLELVIASLTANLEMGLSNVTGGFLASMAPLLATAQLTLFASEGLLCGPVKPGILNGVAVRVRQEAFQANINPDSRMLARAWGMLLLLCILTGEKGIPMPIRAQNQIRRLGGPFDGPMHLDLEGSPKLRRNDEVFLVLMQVRILSVLPKLNGVPLVGLLETRKAAGDLKFFAGEETFEGLRKSIGKTLNGGGRNMLAATALECLGQIVLRGKGARLSILSFDGREHLIVNDARLPQALHEQLALFLIEVKAILKCLHEGILIDQIRIVKGYGPYAQAPNKERLFHPHA